MKYIATLITFLIFLSLSAVSQDLTASAKFRFDIPEEEQVLMIAGYRAHFGTVSGEYTKTVDLPMSEIATELDPPHYTFTVGDLALDTTYFSALTAYNFAGLESEYSDEISLTTPTAPEKPTGFGVVGEFEVTSSLEDWEPIAAVDMKDFFRVKL